MWLPVRVCLCWAGSMFRMDLVSVQLAEKVVE